MRRFHEYRAPGAEGSRRPTRLVVADDEASVRKIVGRIARRFYPQLVVVEAEDGDAVLDLIDADVDDIACIVADVIMPRRDGFSMCWSLRHAVPYLPCRDLPVVLMSGVLVDDLALERAWNAGTAFLLAKPFSEAELVRALAAATRLPPAAVPRDPGDVLDAPARLVSRSAPRDGDESRSSMAPGRWDR